VPRPRRLPTISGQDTPLAPGTLAVTYKRPALIEKSRLRFLELERGGCLIPSVTQMDGNPPSGVEFCERSGPPSQASPSRRISGSFAATPWSRRPAGSSVDVGAHSGGHSRVHLVDSRSRETRSGPARKRIRACGGCSASPKAARAVPFYFHRTVSFGVFGRLVKPTWSEAIGLTSLGLQIRLDDCHRVVAAGGGV
jgi:hypothetical protein